MTATAARGRLELVFERRLDGRTVLTGRRQDFPLRMTVPMYLDPGDAGMAFVYVQNPTGAVFAGDDLRIRVDAGAGARIHLTSQSATKLMPAVVEETARQELVITAGPGAFVEVIPDALIPHRDARYEQSTRVELAAGAAFIGAEMLAPGRRPLGERFAYGSVRIDTRVARDGRCVCIDTIDLRPSRYDPGAYGIMGEFDWSASLLVVADAIAPAAVAEAIGDAAALRSDTAVGAAGTLPDGCGVTVRIAAHDAVGLKRAVIEAWDIARRAVTGVAAPRERK